MYRVYVLEDEVRKSYNEDKSSGNFYLTVKELAKYLISTRKFISPSHTEYLSHLVAVDIFEMVNYRKIEIFAWTKYLIYVIQNNRTKLLNEYNSSIIQVDDPVSQDRLLSLLYQDTYQDQPNIELQDYLSNLDHIILGIYDKIIKYSKDSPLYEYLKISVMHTIINYLSESYTVVRYQVPISYNGYISYLTKYILEVIRKDFTDLSENRDKIHHNSNQLNLPFGR